METVTRRWCAFPGLSSFMSLRYTNPEPHLGCSLPNTLHGRLGKTCL